MTLAKSNVDKTRLAVDIASTKIRQAEDVWTLLGRLSDRSHAVDTAGLEVNR